MTTVARDFGTVAQLSTMVTAQLRRLAVARKTRALAAIQLVPILGAIVYVLFEDVDGLTMFSNIVEQVTFPFLIPLAALFYGGPAIVDEMEGRTLTFLTLRPIGKSTMFFGKVISAVLIALPMVLVPLALLFVICLFQSDDMGATFNQFLQILGASSAGVIAYTAIFAALGAIFASSLLASIVYFVTVEIVLGALPIVELLAVKYHVRNMAGLEATDRLGAIESLVVDEPINIVWWASLAIAAIYVAGATGVGAYVFKEKQYYV